MSNYTEALRMVERGDLEQAAVLARLAVADKLEAVTDRLDALLIELADIGQKVTR